MTTLVLSRLNPLVPLVAMPHRGRTLTFLDIETTGLNPVLSDIVEVAAMKVDERTLAVLDMVETRVRSPTGTFLDPEAIALNGFNLDDWLDAPSADQVLPQLRTFLDGSRIVGHNPGFDWAFLRTAYFRFGLAAPDIDCHLLDTASLAWPLLRRGLVPSLSLRELCAFFGISNEGAHHALRDVVRTYQLFLKLIGETPKAVLQ
jgi:DNA polymerase-3 subunit epsilon